MELPLRPIFWNILIFWRFSSSCLCWTSIKCQKLEEIGFWEFSHFLEHSILSRILYSTTKCFWPFVIFGFWHKSLHFGHKPTNKIGLYICNGVGHTVWRLHEKLKKTVAKAYRIYHEKMKAHWIADIFNMFNTFLIHLKS